MYIVSGYELNLKFIHLKHASCIKLFFINAFSFKMKHLKPYAYTHLIYIFNNYFRYISLISKIK